MPDGSDDRLQLAATQQRLYEALVERNHDLGEWYLAAIGVLNDDGLPDRHALAAHALREVMEKLPAVDITPDQGASLPQKVRELEPAWTRAQHENQCCGGAWGGEISDTLREFLAAMQGFFDGQEELTRSRREHAQRFLEGLDGIGGLPEDMQHKNVRKWMDLRSYFVAVAHHKTVKEADFRARIAEFEVFISTRLRPRPTDDFAAIDALLEED